MNEEISEEEKTYTEPVDITIGTDVITWTPGVGALSVKSGEYASTVVNALEDYIYYSAYDRETIRVSPVGPFLPATVSDIRTVVWAVESLFKDADISYSGDVPALEDMGLADDQDKKEIEDSDAVKMEIVR